MSEHVQTPSGHAHADVIQEVWKKDTDAPTLKVVPHITKSHIQPNSFEKMRLNLAFQLLFSEEVLKGLFFYKEDLEKKKNRRNIPNN